MRTHRTSPSKIAVLAKAAQVLDAVSSGEAVNFSEISRTLGLPRPTVHRIVQSLIASDVLTREHRPGPRLLRWASWAFQHSELQDVAADVLRDLVSAFRETASVYVRTGAARTCLARVEGTEPLHHHVPIGVPFPLHVGSAGRILLAWLDADTRDRLIAESVEWSQVPTSALPPDWDAIRSEGWATTCGERDPVLASVSVPVRDAGGGVVAALSVSGPKQRFTPQRVREMVQSLLDKARDLREKIL